jgi:hypothetical protein
MSDKSVLQKLFSDIFSTASPLSTNQMIGAAVLTSNNKAPPPLFPTKTTPVIPTKIQVPVLVGGFVKEIDAPIELYKRIFLITFLITLCIYCASVTFRSTQILHGVLKLHGEKDPTDPNLDNEDENYYSRWRRIAQIIVVLSMLSIAYFIAIVIILFIIIFIVFYIYLSITIEDENVSIVKLAFNYTSEIIKHILWNYYLGDKEQTLFKIYAMLIIIIFITIAIFLGYHLFVKSYLKNIAYPQVVDTNKTDKPEFTNPTKFAMYYGLYIILMVLFYIILLAFYNFNFDSNTKLCIINIAFAIITMMFIMIIYKYTLDRSKPIKIFILWLVYSIFTLVMYFVFDLKN